jgi:hypothetical protein
LRRTPNLSAFAKSLDASESTAALLPEGVEGDQFVPRSTPFFTRPAKVPLGSSTGNSRRIREIVELSGGCSVTIKVTKTSTRTTRQPPHNLPVSDSVRSENRTPQRLENTYPESETSTPKLQKTCIALLQQLAEFANSWTS